MTMTADRSPIPAAAVAEPPAAIPEPTDEALRHCPALAAWWHLARCYNALALRFMRFFDDEDLTGAQYGVLRSVGEAGPEGLKLTDLSRRLMVTCGNITGVVDRLEEAGLLRRDRSAEDRRVLMARLTAAGWERYRTLVPRYRAFVADLLSGMPETDKRLLADLCERLHASLIEEVRSPGSEVRGHGSPTPDFGPRTPDYSR
jgi:DNA-binding MarR family transcriptional regulator